MPKVKEDRKVRKFKLVCFEVEGEEFTDVSKAKEKLDLGKEVIALGDVCLHQGGGMLRVRTSILQKIRMCKNHYELLTASHVYVVN